MRVHLGFDMPNVPTLQNLQVVPSKVKALVRSIQIAELQSVIYALAPWRWAAGQQWSFSFPATLQVDTPPNNASKKKCSDSGQRPHPTMTTRVHYNTESHHQLLG